jgi:hypothetical protein
VTIYIPRLRQLPLEQLSLVGAGARFSVSEADGSIATLAYEWEDLKVVVNVLSTPELARHLEGLVAWVRSVARAQGRPPEEPLIQRIRSTTLVLGFVVDGTTDRDVWHGRVQDMIAMICSNTGALLFWEGAVFDENCQQLLPATNEASLAFG